jgi:rhomboid family GlyGly-CTERM serine protease
VTELERQKLTNRTRHDRAIHPPRPVWLLGLLALLLVALGGEGAMEALRYERAAVLAGEYWRLVSAHFVHGTTQHLILNLLGLGVIAALFPRNYTFWEWIGVGTLSIAAIGAGFVFYEPQLDWYVGFSGVLHGALAAGCIAWWATETRLLALTLSLVFAGKLLWEQTHGALPLSGDLAVVVDAHRYGAIGGAIAASIIWLRRQPWSFVHRSL